MAAKKTKTSKKAPKRKAPGKKARAKAAPAKKSRAAGKTSASASDAPSFFRITLEVGNLDQAEEFYSKLFDTKGLRSAGARVYIQAGPVALQILDVSEISAPHPAAKSLYFTVKNLQAIHDRAQFLGALSDEPVHGSPGGEIAKRPWGERSFYAQDPWGNPLCFVEAGTTYG